MVEGVRRSPTPRRSERPPRRRPWALIAVSTAPGCWFAFAAPQTSPVAPPVAAPTRRRRNPWSGQRSPSRSRRRLDLVQGTDDDRPRHPSRRRRTLASTEPAKPTGGGGSARRADVSRWQSSLAPSQLPVGRSSSEERTGPLLLVP